MSSDSSSIHPPSPTSASTSAFSSSSSSSSTNTASSTTPAASGRPAKPESTSSHLVRILYRRWGPLEQFHQN
ncbi:uncharacterized protein PGTG_22729, partial [Puccinia graminis f. sp. tritici CRL 75-36-700-3]